ncbi:MAG: hypothetical protein RIR86_2608 [Acidobacteriota bacterium]
MMKISFLKRLVALVLAASLLAPAPALAASRSGKKNFREGQKYEILLQWDLAVHHYSLAVAAEPNNPEYRLHYLRALQQASLWFVKTGDSLAEQQDFGGAYAAYLKANSYDQANEIARLKMERMKKLQADREGGIDGGLPNKIGNVFPTNNEIQFARKERPRIPANIAFKDTKFKSVVSNLGRQLNLNVVFDESVKDSPVSIELNDVTLAKSLDIILKIYKYSFEQVDNRTILVYADNPTNRPRFETLMVKTFFLGNLTSQQARTALTSLLPAGRQIVSIDQPNNAGGNVILVKATATELQLVQDILDSLDKNKNEVVLDVEIYEVSHDTLLQLGNQIVSTALSVTETRLDSSGKPLDFPLGSTASLNNLGGIGRANSGKIVGNTLTPFLGGIGTLIGLPPTQLSLLQSRGDAKLLNRAQVHVLDGGKNQTKVGRSVPVRLGTTFGFGGFGGGGALGGAGGVGAGAAGGVGGVGGFGGGFGGFPGIDSIQYRDVGLVIEAKPIITNEGYVEIEMKFETSDIVSSGSDATNLTPSFTQRALNTTARIQDGVTAVVAGINTESNGASRASIPILGMIPILGRFITTPRQDSRQSDLIITVTPHIVRSQGINSDDHLAKFAGQAQAGPTPSVEDVVFRAQLVEERERRMIAQQQGATPDGQAPANQPASQNVLTSGSPANPATGRPAQPAPIQPVVQTPTGTPVQPAANTPPPDSAQARPRPRVINDEVIARSGIVPNSVSAAASGGSGGDLGRPLPPSAREPVSMPPPNPATPSAPGVTPTETPLPRTDPGPGGPGGTPGKESPGARPAETVGGSGQPGEPRVNATGEAGAGASEASGEAGGAGGEAGGDEAGQSQLPPTSVQPAVLRTVRRPEHVERAIARARAEAEKRRQEEKRRPKKEEVIPPEVMASLNPKSAPPPPMVLNTASMIGLMLEVAPRTLNATVGNPVKLDIEADSKKPTNLTRMTIKFDTSKLKVTGVSAGELLGTSTQLDYKMLNGNLVIQFNSSPGVIKGGKGKVLTIEFATSEIGQSEIAIDTKQTTIRDEKNGVLQWRATGSRVAVIK